jgi:hypothetical protein
MAHEEISILSFLALVNSANASAWYSWRDVPRSLANSTLQSGLVVPDSITRLFKFRTDCERQQSIQVLSLNGICLRIFHEWFASYRVVKK